MACSFSGKRYLPRHVKADKRQHFVEGWLGCIAWFRMRVVHCSPSSALTLAWHLWCMLTVHVAQSDLLSPSPAQKSYPGQGGYFFPSLYPEPPRPPPPICSHHRQRKSVSQGKDAALLFPPSSTTTTTSSYLHLPLPAQKSRHGKMGSRWVQWRRLLIAEEKRMHRTPGIRVKIFVK